VGTKNEKEGERNWKNFGWGAQGGKDLSSAATQKKNYTCSNILLLVCFVSK
jgi:hypothetical protein